MPLIEDDVPLAPRCTLELGGPARHYLRACTEEDVGAGLRFAAERGQAVGILGGGSNLVIADEGFPGLVIDTGGLRGREVAEGGGDEVHLSAAAGEPWDELVAFSVGQGLAGLECLSGIPGSCGATPIQNVGAYGQEVAAVMRSVRVMDQASLKVSELPAGACGFGYRESLFRREPGRYVVLAVTFALRRGGAPTLRYGELLSALSGVAPDLAAVRRAVLGLRRGKSMVIDPLDENRRSVGSFFMNPVLGVAQLEEVERRAVALGVVREGAEVPRYPAGPGRVKLAAGWLIERAGLRKGERRGAVGISTKHALALIHHGEGGGRTAELVALAGEVRARVRERFGVDLRPEPVAWGFAWDEAAQRA